MSVQVSEATHGRRNINMSKRKQGLLDSKKVEEEEIEKILKKIVQTKEAKEALHKRMNGKGQGL